MDRLVLYVNKVEVKGEVLAILPNLNGTVTVCFKEIEDQVYYANEVKILLEYGGDWACLK